jgi:hypothetical protein
VAIEMLAAAEARGLGAIAVMPWIDLILDTAIQARDLIVRM